MGAAPLRKINVTRYRLNDWRIRWLLQHGFRIKVRDPFVLLVREEKTDAESAAKL